MPAACPVLLVEDDENDSLLFRLACEEAGIRNPVIIAKNGVEALDFLGGATGGRRLPCLVVTDLKMSRMDGFKLLDRLQRQQHLKALPAVVLSSSNELEDQRRALALGAREYIQKPLGLVQMMEVVKRLHGTWLDGDCAETDLLPA